MSRACGSIVRWSLDRPLRSFEASTQRRVAREGDASIELPVFDRAFDAERARDPLDTLIDAVAAALDDAPLTLAISPALGDLRLDTAAILMAAAAVEVRRAADAETQARAIADAVHAALVGGAGLSDVIVAWVSSDDAAASTTLRVLGEAGIPVTDLREQRSRRSNRVERCAISAAGR